MDMQELVAPFARLLADICTPAAVRALEDGGDITDMWASFEASGFLDAMVSEPAGGAGLSLEDVAPLIALLGSYAVPLPVGDTIVARALLAAADCDIPQGPIVIGGSQTFRPFSGVTAHVLSGTPELPALISGAESVGNMTGLRPVAASLRAMLISGAANRVMEMTVAYASERTQFGKPIGRQQAVQQQIAVLAEHAVAARIAASIGARAGLPPKLGAVAVAKHGTSVAAVQISAIAHAVHGAIGISEEYDLQLFTRRMHEWRLADGSESYWARILGGLRREGPAIATSQFIRGITSAALVN